MRRFLPVGLVTLLIAAAPPSNTHPPKAGTYELATGGGQGIEMVYWLIKITPKDDGAIDAELVASNPRAPAAEVTGAKLAGNILHINFKAGSTKLIFEGRVPSAGAEKLLGSMGDENRLSPASLTFTDKDKIEANNSIRRAQVPEAMLKALQLGNKSMMLRVQAGRAKDADEKAKLTAESVDAEKEAAVEVPKLYREVVENHADSPAAAMAAMDLIARAGAYKVSTTEAQKLARVCMTAAEARGPRYEADFRIQLAEALTADKTLAPVALPYAIAAEKALNATSTTDQQVRVLGVLAATQRKAGKIADAELTDVRVAKLETVLDNEYLAKMPPFKPETYAGRKEQSDRVVVMELFTGAQCPPCVAADVGFDALEKTYKPTDVVLLQYHLHIPGPDPLTNPTTEARAKHYKVNSTPTTLFNGKKEAAGGGGIGNSETKYKQYRDIIDKLLEEPAKAAVSVDANRQGESIAIRAKVSNLAEPGEKVRLRLALVEEAVRYVGGNKLRFHHMVVRTMPGSPEGFALTEKESQHTAKVSLADLRSRLTTYLDETAEKRPYPKPDRPMAMKHLKVIAFVQDDETGDILQAAMADLGGEHASK